MAELPLPTATLKMASRQYNQSMAGDPYSAVWVSHSSMSDFLNCPRLYYLKNVYRDPKTRHKISTMSPALALGQVVHAVLENLSELPTNKRFQTPLTAQFEQAWQKVSGQAGGFSHPDQEQRYKQRGLAMIQRVMAHPGPLANLAVKIKMDLPHYWLSEADNIILCGKIDWLEYLPATDSVNIIDFKTGQREEAPGSLQLPIYYLLVRNCQKRQVNQAAYWYLETDNELRLKELPDADQAHQAVLETAKKIALARKLNVFKCPTQGCRFCQPFEAVLRGEAQLVGTNEYQADVYIFNRPPGTAEEDDSVIL